MENPASFGEAEKIVSKVVDDHQRDLDNMVCGLSLERRITNALREAGLLKKESCG